MIMITEKVYFRDLRAIAYQEAWDLQSALQAELIARKRRNRNLPESDRETLHHYLLFCEHNPVYTLGKSGAKEHLLLSEDQLESGAYEYFKINRGGDITYHGPGQITGYPIFDLDDFFTDVHRYVRTLEEVVIFTLEEYGIVGKRIKDYTGVWIDVPEGEIQRKICAIGVHLSRWVTLHGFAFNVNTRLEDFKNIIPCGIQDDDKTVTSIEKEIGRKVDMKEVKTHLKRNFAALFQYEYIDQ